MSASLAILRRSISRVSLILKPRLYSSSTLPVSRVSLISRVSVPKKLATNSVSTRLASSKVVVSDSDKIRKADESLLRALESELSPEEVEEDLEQEEELPKYSPFEIIDNPGDQTIVLKREFDGEKIQATIYMNLDEDNEEDNDDAEDNDSDSDSAQDATISMEVRIDKGPGPVLEVCCNLTSEELEIMSMAMKRPENSDEAGYYQGPDFSDLDESVQKAFHKYLAARGFKKSLFNYLHDYMLTKEEKEYYAWLKNLKEFVEK